MAAAMETDCALQKGENSIQPDIKKELFEEQPSGEDNLNVATEKGNFYIKLETEIDIKEEDNTSEKNPDDEENPNSGDRPTAKENPKDGRFNGSAPDVPYTSLTSSPSTSEIVVSNTTSKYQRNSKYRNMCYYCKQEVLNLCRHFKRRHREQKEVKDIFSLPPKSRERSLLIAALRKRGNYASNLKECIRPVKLINGKIGSYLPCKYCLGYYSQKYLWRHVKKCPLGDGSKSSCSYITDAQNLLVDNLEMDQELKEIVFSRMAPDNVSLTAKKDILICMYGAEHLKRHKKQDILINVCSRKMRDLARLLIKMKKVNKLIKNLFDVLHPKHFTEVVQCVKQIAKYNVEMDTYESYSYTVNIYSELNQCASIAISAVDNHKYTCDDESPQKIKGSIETFKQLLRETWHFIFSKKENNVTKIEKLRKVTTISLAADVKIFRDYLLNAANKAMRQLKNNEKDCEAYKLLMEVVFCNLFLLNRLRIAELQTILLDNYKTNISDENYKELSINTPILTEKVLLLKKSKVIIIENKQETKVPVFFSNELEQYVKLLLELRKDFVKEDNPYLFANGLNNLYTEGYKMLEKHFKQSGARNSITVFSRLKNHRSTINQIFNMSPNEIEQLVYLMGCTNSTHYSSDNVHQVAKIARLIVLINSDKNFQCLGMNLDEIEVDLEESVQERQTKECESANENSVTANNSNKNKQNVIVKRKQLNCNSSNSVVFRSKSRVLTPWTDQQKQLIRDFFKDHIKNKKPPRQMECLELKQKYSSIFNNKTWQQMKVYIQNVYSKKLR